MIKLIIILSILCAILLTFQQTGVVEIVNKKECNILKGCEKRVCILFKIKQ